MPNQEESWKGYQMISVGIQSGAWYCPSDWYTSASSSCDRSRSGWSSASVLSRAATTCSSSLTAFLICPYCESSRSGCSSASIISRIATVCSNNSTAFLICPSHKYASVSSNCDASRSGRSSARFFFLHLYDSSSCLTASWVLPSSRKHNPTFRHRVYPVEVYTTVLKTGHLRKSFH